MFRSKVDGEPFSTKVDRNPPSFYKFYILGRFHEEGNFCWRGVEGPTDLHRIKDCAVNSVLRNRNSQDKHEKIEQLRIIPVCQPE